MIHQDAMYGEIYLPNYLAELIESQEMQRLRNISQDVLPRNCVPWEVPSRFEHSMGVCSLLMFVLQHNALPKREALLLTIAALFHDAGNPCLSHLSEPFLKHLTGKDGESFLEEMLHGTPVAAFIERCGLSVEEVVQCVTGHAKPYSVVLNGSMDIDNLDNVNRYWFTHQAGEIRFNAQFLASSFIFRNEASGWELKAECLEEARKWQDARHAVYELIYGNPHLNAAMMIYRALDIALHYNQIPEQFFHLNDDQALEFLSTCNEDSAHLVDRARAHQWYQEIAFIETNDPHPHFCELCDRHWNLRSVIAEYVREQVHIPRGAICCYAGKGRDKRRIELPFVSDNGSQQFDHDGHGPIYRLKVYVDPEFEHKKESVEYWVRYMIS